LQASNAYLSAGSASPDEFYDLYAMDLEPEGQWARARRFMRHRLAVGGRKQEIFLNCLFKGQSV
jgi:hypothetical protein